MLVYQRVSYIAIISYVWCLISPRHLRPKNPLKIPCQAKLLKTSGPAGGTAMASVKQPEIGESMA